MNSRTYVADVLLGRVDLWRRRIIVLAMFVAAGSATLVRADQPTWVEPDVPQPLPDARSNYALTYDSARQRIVLFGGRSPARALLGDTWEWNGLSWTLVHAGDPSGVLAPSPREEHAMAFDSCENVVVLFGGIDGTGAGADTWEWDGSTWTNTTGSPSPDPRFDHAMAFDSNNCETVLFGGGVNVPGLQDTWTRLGTVWSEESPNSVPAGLRWRHAMCFDSCNSVVMLFGGQVGGDANGETWRWDGTDWVLMDVGDPSGITAPLPRWDHEMAYDGSRCECVLFGGYSGTNPPLGDTWEWNGNTWTERFPTVVPEARYDHAMAYDSDRCGTVLFGGYNGTDILGDTWLYGSGVCPAVPATSEWGLIVTMLLFLTAGTLFLFRRAATAASQ